MFGLNDFITDKKKEYYVYGAGVVGYYLIKFLLEQNVIVKNIIVSDINNNINNYFGIDVISINELCVHKNDCFIIVATLEDKQKEICALLKQRGYNNVYGLPEREYRIIRGRNPEISSEIQQQLIGLKRNSRVVNNGVIKINTKLDNVNIKLSNAYVTIKDNLNIIYGQLVKIAQLLDDNYYDYLDNKWDEYLYKEDFLAVSADKSKYVELIEELIAGLGEEDIEEVYRILHRLNLICQDKKVKYTDEEKKMLRQIEEGFYKKIYTLNEEMHIYKNYCLPKRHFEQPVFWYRHGLELLDSLAFIKDKNIIDAGAYIGDSALILSEYTDEKVYSFEAEPKNYELMRKTIEMNKRQNIVSVNEALLDKKGKTKIYCSDMKDSCNSMSEMGKFVNADRYVEVNCTTIDDYVSENNLKIGLIKTDVEGAEKKLLEGAINTIREQRPTMIISIYHSIEDFFTIKPWVEKLQLGYRFKLFRPIIKRSFMSETVLICECEGWR